MLGVVDPYEVNYTVVLPYISSGESFYNMKFLEHCERIGIQKTIFNDILAIDKFDKLFIIILHELIELMRPIRNLRSTPWWL